MSMIRWTPKFNKITVIYRTPTILRDSGSGMQSVKWRCPQVRTKVVNSFKSSIWFANGDRKGFTCRRNPETTRETVIEIASCAQRNPSRQTALTAKRMRLPKKKTKLPRIDFLGDVTSNLVPSTPAPYFSLKIFYFSIEKFLQQKSKRFFFYKSGKTKN